MMTPTATNGRYKLIKPTEQDAAYRAALELVARIDEDLTRGVRHYYTKSGRLLYSLDQVIGAILSNGLLMPEERAGVIWTPRGLAA
jgi:hypothetical protein